MNWYKIWRVSPGGLYRPPCLARIHAHTGRDALALYSQMTGTKAELAGLLAEPEAGRVRDEHRN